MEIIAAYGDVLIALALLFGLYMTWGIGANDVANAMGPPVGSGAITVKYAILVAAVFELAGAVLAGGHVTETIRKGIIDPTSLADRPHVLVLGMLAALLAAAVWLMVASNRGWPVSTTHAIVGAMVGFAAAGISLEAVEWGMLGQILASWVVSPLLGALLAYVLMMSIRRLILNTPSPFQSARRWGPGYVFLVGFVISLVSLFKGLGHLELDLSAKTSLLSAVAVGALVAAFSWLLIHRVEVDPGADRDYQFASVEKVFTPMMIFTACAMAFTHGSNDVANGIGPAAAVLSIVRSGGEVTQASSLPAWILLLGGGGIVLGILTLGYKVIRTLGTKITELTPTRGFCTSLAAAATVALASRTGLPVSTTHVVVGSIIGVGVARGLGAIDMRVIGGILFSWLITLPVAGTLAAVFFFALKGLFQW